MMPGALGRMDPLKRGSVWSAVSRASDTRDRRSLAAFSRSSTRSLLRVHSDGPSDKASLWKTVTTAVNVFAWKQQLLDKTALCHTSSSISALPPARRDERRVQDRTYDFSGPVTLAQGSKSRAVGSGITPAGLQYRSKGAWKRLRVVMSKWLCMDASYFLHLWNFLGLLSYALVISSFVRFVLAWSLCSQALAGSAAGAASAGVERSDGGPLRRGSFGDDARGEGAVGRESCTEELVKLRVLTALAIPGTVVGLVCLEEEKGGSETGVGRAMSALESL